MIFRMKRSTPPLLPLLLPILLLLTTAGMAQAAASKATISTAANFTALPPGEKALVAIVVDIPEGLHAQSNTPAQPNLIPFKVTMDEHPAVKFAAPVYPRGHDEIYPDLGTLNVYTGRVIAYVPVEVLPGAPPGPLTLAGQVQYQLCDDRACYAPQQPSISAELTVLPPGSKAQPNPSDLFAGYEEPKPARAAWSIWTALGAALIAGLLFNIMPCVLPVLPLKAVGFYEASHHNRGRSFMLGIVFSIGLISVFAVLALVVLVLRLVSWGELFSKGWFIWAVVLLLIGLGMGLLGAWNLALPLGVYRFEPRHDTWSGNFFWGALTAVLATPCTAPLLPPVLAWAALQPVIIGVPAVLMVGVGMALPYLILSAFPELARRFPRSGPWTELFKQMMGFLLLASAAYFGAGRLIHGPDFWWVVVAVVAIASLYLVARTVQLTQSAGAVGIAATIAVVMLGGTLWWTAKITGLGAAGGNGVAAADSAWQTFTDAEFQKLRQANKPVLIKFTANWCATCQYIEGTVFRDARVWNALKQRNVTTLKVDMTNADVPGRDLLLSLNPAGGIPLTAIYAAGAQTPVVLESVYSSADLLTALESVRPPLAAGH